MPPSRSRGTSPTTVPSPRAGVLRRPAPAGAADGREGDAREGEEEGDAGAESPLALLFDAAEEAGVVDHERVADVLGCTPGTVRLALAGAVDAALAGAPERVAALAAALGVDRGAVRDALVRGASARGAVDRVAAGRASTGAPLIQSDPPEGPADRGAAWARRTPGDHGLPSVPVARLTDVQALDRTVAAIDADVPWGPAARLAVIDAAERTARAAGRPVPPALHALRARVRPAPVASGATGPAEIAPNAPPAVGAPAAGGHAADPLPPRLARGGDPEHAALTDDAARAVRLLQEAAPGYDDLFAPLHDDALALLVRRHGLRAWEAPLGATSAGVVTPPLWGTAFVVVSAGATADQRRLALRVALAHAALGTVREDAPLPAPAPEPAARIAELAALADLLPFWQLADLRRRGRLGWRALEAHLAAAVAALAGDWPPSRAADRAALRVALYRRTGL